MPPGTSTGASTSTPATPPPCWAAAHTKPAPPKSYDPVNFERNLPKWTETIESGRKTAKEYIDFAVTRGEPFTEEQKARLLSVKKAPAQQAHEEAQDVQVKQPPSDAPAVTYADLAGRLRAAKSQDELDEIGTLIGAVENQEHRRELSAIYDQCASALNGSGE